MDVISHLSKSILVLTETFNNDTVRMKIATAGRIMTDALHAGNKIICIGNGGSMCDAMHFASELTGKYMDVRQPLPAMALSDPAAMTCITNDFGYESVFKRQLIAFAKPGDVLLALSTSGTSDNVLYAMLNCELLGVKVVGITGGHDGLQHAIFHNACREPADAGVCIKIPSRETALVQQATMAILHALVEIIEKEIL